MEHAALTFLVALFFAVIHIASPRLKPTRLMPPTGWLSFAGGLSVGYVFVHVLPELAGHQATLENGDERRLVEGEIFLMALVGLAAFYGLEHLARSTAAKVGEDDDDRRSRHPGFWLHIFAFSLYSALIGFILAARSETDLRELTFYAVALGVHFFVSDRALSRHHGRLHDIRGRWILAGAVLAGWGLGMVAGTDHILVGFLFAFLAGAIILNVLKEELPAERDGRVGAFALGAGCYVAIALAI